MLQTTPLPRAQDTAAMFFSRLPSLPVFYERPYPYADYRTKVPKLARLRSDKCDRESGSGEGWRGFLKHAVNTSLYAPLRHPWLRRVSESPSNLLPPPNICGHPK